MKLIVLALVFQFVISCWPKTNIVNDIETCCLLVANEHYC